MVPSKRITDNEGYAKFYFTPTGEENKEKCLCGADISQKTGEGYSNLMAHIKVFHKNYEWEAKDNQGVVKILSGKERALTEGESVACRSLVKNDNADIIETHDEENFADGILAKKSKKEESGYMNCKFLLPTSTLQSVSSVCRELR